MRIVIPMAGKSKRFTSKGYMIPKPFMMIDGQPMAHWVCDMFSSEDDYVFIIQKEHGANPTYREMLESAVARCSIIEIEPHDKGPIVTALAADCVVPDEEPVILTYCDFYQHWDYQKFLWATESYDGGIAVFTGYQPASFGDTYYGYVRCNERGEMLELREKKPFTDQRHLEPASSGVYYVRSWKMFCRFAEKVMREGIQVAGEHYVSLLYNPMVKMGLKVITYKIDKFICWGTPEDVEQYLFWSDYFRNDVPKTVQAGRSESPTAIRG
jgi:NDP-sugar pyrophosphorylase family protein